MQPRFFVILLFWSAGALAAAEKPSAIVARAESSPLHSFFVSPTRILWKSEHGVRNAESLLASQPGQAMPNAPHCLLKSEAGQFAGILLDFGVEIAGSVELFTPATESKTSARVRIRFGESASEAMAELGGAQNAGNDHAIRDQTVVLPWLGKTTIGPSGFRFVRIDALDADSPVALSQVRAVLTLRDVPYVGSFKCDDERLNRIWAVGAYTVHLTMQEYLWDGIKRDRLVWIGDMHPEVSVIDAVFGSNDVVPRSLDLTRDLTPATEWMNGISSYSMWWVLIQEEWYQHHGDRAYLQKQKSYLQALLTKLTKLVGEDGHEKLDGLRFLDWPSSTNQEAVTAGLQALLVLTLESGQRLMSVLDDSKTSALCAQTAARARKVVPDANGSKAAASLLVLAGMTDAKHSAGDLLETGGARNLSTFYGFYVLQALAKGGEMDAALEIVRNYWGAMLDRGARTFWEDFDLDWLKDSGRIDELLPAGKKDLHGDFGAFGYKGFRQSLCHGWASGPTAWLSQQVLGIQPLEPGFARVRIAPQLGSLKWAEGTYPTPLGPIKVRHERQADGTIKSKVEAPPGVKVEQPARPR